ncbi:MAG TPA: metallophosphoesterase, partial [Polyangiaceae bacterium]|nr:metallophosphoesterase [Polyangiaceae bacterium]
MHSLARSFGLVALAVACGNGLSQNEHGNLSARTLGSLEFELADRGAPDAGLLASCGDGSVTKAGEAALQRLPFLQQVTSETAIIVFKTTQPGSVNIELTSTDGALVSNSVSQADPSVADGTQQLVRLEGLQPSHTYCYSLDGLTAAAGFRTAPDLGSERSVRFVAFGDSGSDDSDQFSLLSQLQTVPFDLIVHTGDLAYESGTIAQLDRTVFDVYAPLLRSFALFPVTGNHDYDTNHGAPFMQAFVLPEDGDPTLPERWYSFDWGNVHFVGLDTEQTGDAEAAWLDEDLKQNELPWTIVFAHRPPYSSGEHGSDAAFRRYFVPVLEKYQVPLVLNGHDHD